jgi:hypothetical protein
MNSNKLILALVLFATPAAAQSYQIQATPSPAPVQYAWNVIQVAGGVPSGPTPTATPTALPGNHYTDSFTRSVNTLLNANCAGSDTCEWEEIEPDSDKGVNGSEQYITDSSGAGRIATDADAESTNLSQYVAAKYMGTVASTYQGIVLRDEGGFADDEFYYALTIDGNATTLQIRAGIWAGTTALITDITTANVGPAEATLASGDSLGIEVNHRTGNDITFTVYHWADQSPPNRGSWGTGWTVCTATCDQGFDDTTPTGTGRNADTGKRGGILNMNGDAEEWDDWMFGDNPIPMFTVAYDDDFTSDWGWEMRSTSGSCSWNETDGYVEMTNNDGLCFSDTPGDALNPDDDNQWMYMERGDDGQESTGLLILGKSSEPSGEFNYIMRCTSGEMLIRVCDDDKGCTTLAGAGTAITCDSGAGKANGLMVAGTGADAEICGWYWASAPANPDDPSGWGDAGLCVSADGALSYLDGVANGSAGATIENWTTSGDPPNNCGGAPTECKGYPADTQFYTGLYSGTNSTWNVTRAIAGTHTLAE